MSIHLVEFLSVITSLDQTILLICEYYKSYGNFTADSFFAILGLTNTVTAVKNAQMAESPVLLLGGAAATLLKVCNPWPMCTLQISVLFVGQTYT